MCEKVPPRIPFQFAGRRAPKTEFAGRRAPKNKLWVEVAGFWQGVGFGTWKEWVAW